METIEMIEKELRGPRNVLGGIPKPGMPPPIGLGEVELGS